MDHLPQPASRHWYWLPAVGLLALAAILAVYQNMRVRMEANREQFLTAQRLRLERVERHVDAYFGDAEQLVRVGALAAPDLSGNWLDTKRFTEEMFRARKTTDVYGLGVFYAPYAFDPKARFVSVYDRAGIAVDPYFDTKLAGGVIQVLFYGDSHEKSDDYTAYTWYSAAAQHPGGTAWIGPYREDGGNFISTVRAFMRNGRVEGVFSVDILTSRFKAMLREGLDPSDVASIESSRGATLVGTAAQPDAADTISSTMPLRYTRARLRLSSDATPLHYTNDQLVTVSIVLMVLVVGLAGVAAMLLVQRWQREDETARLQAGQARLEHEVAVSRRVESELRRMAYTDTLTGLPNRAAFMDWTRAHIEAGHVDRAVFLIDLDRFNIVNETVGHTAGDELLRAIAARLTGRLSKEFSVARMGGNEFVVVAPAGDDPLVAGGALRQLIVEPIVVAGQTFHMHASVGIVTIDGSYASAEEVLRDADIAVHYAKEQGRARSARFDETMRSRVARESELEADLRLAIEDREFLVHYQPVIRLATGDIASFEALIRWPREGKDPIPASEFIPFAEARGLIAGIDAIMLRQVCAHATAIRGLFPGRAIAANISAGEFATAGLPALVQGLLAEYALEPSAIKLEITETAMMTGGENAATVMAQLRDLGVELVLDDFGTGYSSLAYLQQLPIAGLKIDRSFVEALGRDDRALEIVRSIVALAAAFELETTAEGVETNAQLQIVSQLGVTYAQGYLFSMAVDIATLPSLQRPLSPAKVVDRA